MYVSFTKSTLKCAIGLESENIIAPSSVALVDAMLKDATRFKTGKNHSEINMKYDLWVHHVH